MRWAKWGWLAPALVFAAVYWPAWQAWFALDDFAWLLLDGMRQRGDSVWSLLFQPSPHGTWRPFSERLTFVLFSWAWPGEVWPFRTAMLAAGVGCVRLAYGLALRMTGSLVAAVAAPLFWLVNMNLAQAVAWNCSLMELLCGLCLLVELTWFVDYCERGGVWRLVGVWVVFLLGFGVMESNVVFPALAAAWVLAYDRRRWKLIVPFALVSAAFVGLHFAGAPKSHGGPYAVHFGVLGLIKNTVLYTAWAFRPPGVDALLAAPKVLITGWAVAAKLSLAGFVGWELWRRRWAAALFAAWALLLFAPVAPLTEHHIPYYLTLPMLGVGLLGGGALARAWAAGGGWRAWGVALAVVWIGLAVPATWLAAAQFRDLSVVARDFVAGARDARRQAGPEGVLVLSSDDVRGYETCLHHNCTSALGLGVSYAEPAWAVALQGQRFPVAADRFVSAAALRQGLEEGRMRVFRISGRRAEERSVAVLEEMKAGRYGGGGALGERTGGQER